MKVFELLNIPQISRLKIIAGESGKDREVDTVNMMDAPDIIDYLKPNELLVTTAYHLKDCPHLLIELIKAMAGQGCSALGIKTKRFIKEIPEEAIKLADSLSLPIIEIPLELSLGEIINHTLRSILDQRAAELTIALETHKLFTNIIMKGKGISQLLQELSRMINLPVQLIDHQLKPIYDSGDNSNISLVKNTLQKAGFTMPSAKMSYISFSMLSNKQTYFLTPVHISEKKLGFLFFIGEIESNDHLSSLTIEQATNVISFALMKEHALKQQDQSLKNHFFLHFLDGIFTSQEEIISRAGEFSLQNDMKYVCAVGKTDDTEDHHSYAQHQQLIDDIYEYIQDEVKNTAPKVHFFTKGELCILLFEVHDDSTSPTLYIKSSLRQVQEKVSNHFENTISFGVSNFSHSFLQNNSAFKEAVDALSKGNLSKKTEYIQTYHTKDTMELLRLIPVESLKDFYTNTLTSFIQSNLEEEQTLLQTLSVYLETHCQISETAKRLFVHRNTVVYRLEKCEEILGKDLKDPETALSLRMAFRIRTLLET